MIWGLKGKVAAREVLVVGSGGVEKNIYLALCRRFKGKGMSWSRAEAQKLLKLRLLRYDWKDWRKYCRRRANDNSSYLLLPIIER